ncbi:hypothetical protein KW799_00255 [Candidatus Parcubacteria bacterium]|nr:hypothetical protein [Candidatus Parcubacteria bacterium]
MNTIENTLLNQLVSLFSQISRLETDLKTVTIFAWLAFKKRQKNELEKVLAERKEILRKLWSLSKEFHEKSESLPA